MIGDAGEVRKRRYDGTVDLVVLSRAAALSRFKLYSVWTLERPKRYFFGSGDRHVSRNEGDGALRRVTR
jgi:hypothetical protein